MYCINCGVRLADTEKQCPLCGVVCFHPELTRPEGEPLYPNNRRPAQKMRPSAAHVVVITLFLLPLLVTLLCDLQLTGGVTWSGYVMGALALAYVIAVLPYWFRRPNPVILVPCDFAAAALYLLYINQATGGDWFLSFAFPVTGGLALIVTAVVVLMRYVRQAGLYIFGGAFLALGAFMLLVGFLIHVTFGWPQFMGWSLCPLAVFVLLGGMLIFLAVCRPARETMERKVFL